MIVEDLVGCENYIVHVSSEDGKESYVPFEALSPAINYATEMAHEGKFNAVHKIRIDDKTIKIVRPTMIFSKRPINITIN